MMQAVMGTLVKRFLAEKLGLDPGQIYHCAVMPCYDKKLEGSREDFMIPGADLIQPPSIPPGVLFCIHMVLRRGVE